MPNTDLAHVQQWEDSEKQFVKISCSEIGRNSKNYEHIIVYTGFSKNADMDEVARYLTDGDEKSMRSSERPVVVLCAYANGSNGMGSSIFFNDFAAKLLGPHILEAEKKLFLSKQDYLELLEKYPGRYGTEIPKNGEFVPYPDPESDRWDLNNRSRLVRMIDLCYPAEFGL